MRKPHDKARALRKDMPSAEKRLWRFIRKKQLGGFSFRRQHTLGPFVVDFACIEAGLVIELDGDQHGMDAAPFRDKRRDAFMEAQGWSVLRFWNRDIYDNVDGVLETILTTTGEALRLRAVEKEDAQKAPFGPSGHFSRKRGKTSLQTPRDAAGKRLVKNVVTE